MRTNILEYLEYNPVRKRTDRIAIVDGDRSFTFAELERFAKRCATILVTRTDTTSQPIAVFLHRCAATIFADLGIVYSGNSYSNIDVNTPALRVKNILDNIRPVLVITSRNLAAKLEPLGYLEDRLFFIEEIEDDSIEINNEVIRKRLDRVIDTDPLCIINTSGSTGTPKGVVLNHRSTIDFVDWFIERLHPGESERIGSLSPFCFDIYTLELNLCLAKGATLVIIPEKSAIFPANLMGFLADHAISFIFWVPPIMVTISKQRLLDKFDLGAIKMVLFAGDIFPMKHLNRWRRALPDAAFVNLYGPIEISVDCTYFVLDREFDDDDPLPIGFPCRNTDVLILNEANQLCKSGEHGELCVRGSSLALGYWNDPENTAKAFVQNPLNARYPELIYRTGDMVYTNERGEIMFVGRKDHQIKHMGYRIELPEIEHQTRSIEGIANACAVYNRKNAEITLFFETDGRAMTPTTIRRKLFETLPKYMLPTAFHHIEDLPRNPNGKIDRIGLAQRLHRMVD